ncbi:hypothetical protein AXG93_3459s1010 [Marchantia polymorpha subsp. ruderalis]|uniref:Integrase catalytic domain-containing protein n=1 Tax=Marchantia polymorpha subsp. ruderalis TaxID=1480154 RepID=A0A176W4A1_MARPO|nr:hypothetical protein AXG93_3459s1010 [Marchantia polymorpha subsp. ruderalis]
MSGDSRSRRRVAKRLDAFLARLWDAVAHLETEVTTVLRRLGLRSRAEDWSEDAGGHYATRNTVIKIVNAGYWWPTMFKDVHDYVRRSHTTRHEKHPKTLHPSSHGLCDKMVEAEATRKDDAATVANFLFKSIITRYGCPLELVSDRGTHFLNKVIEDLTNHFQIKHRKTTPYNPKANGLTEKSNGLLCKIQLKVTVNQAHDWDTKLPAALWAYRTAEKITTKQTPYFLVYGQHPILPIEFEVPTQRTLNTRRMGAEESQLYRLQEVMVLEERRHEAEVRTKQIQLRRKKKYDRKVKPVLLEKGDLALLYDSRHARFLGKLHLRWMGPFRVIEVFPNGFIQLADLAGQLLGTRVIGWRLKKYYAAQQVRSNEPKKSKNGYEITKLWVLEVAARGRLRRKRFDFRIRLQRKDRPYAFGRNKRLRRKGAPAEKHLRRKHRKRQDGLTSAVRLRRCAESTSETEPKSFAATPSAVRNQARTDGERRDQI